MWYFVLRSTVLRVLYYWYIVLLQVLRTRSTSTSTGTIGTVAPIVVVVLTYTGVLAEVLLEVRSTSTS
jgi:hypothetical protein